MAPSGSNHFNVGRRPVIVHLGKFARWDFRPLLIYDDALEYICSEVLAFVGTNSWIQLFKDLNNMHNCRN